MDLSLLNRHRPEGPLKVQERGRFSVTGRERKGVGRDRTGSKVPFHGASLTAQGRNQQRWLTNWGKDQKEEGQNLGGVGSKILFKNPFFFQGSRDFGRSFGNFPGFGLLERFGGIPLR